MIGGDRAQREVPRHGQAKGLRDRQRTVDEDRVGGEEVDSDEAIEGVSKCDQGLERRHAAPGDDDLRATTPDGLALLPCGCICDADHL